MVAYQGFRRVRRGHALAVVTVAIVACGTIFGIQLANAGRGLPGATVPGSGPVPVGTVSGNEKLKSTVMSHGASNTSGSGLVAVDAPISFKCNSTSTCTFTDEGVVQVNDNGNSWALCFVVDGSFSCPYIGILPNDGFVTTESISQTFSGLAPGTHTIQTKAFFDSPGKVDGYDVKYRSYTP